MGNLLSIRTEWLPAEGIASAELSATFCRLEIWLGGQCLTRVEDQRGGGVRDGIYCSAYSLAEWLATRWWSLRQHVRYVDRYADSYSRPSFTSASLDDRHDLRGANDGFLWPACTISPEGDETLVAWYARPNDGTEPITYVTSGRAYVATDELSSSFAAFIESVLERLKAQRVPDSLLAAEWSAIDGADEEEAAFCNAAAALGLDPYDVEPAIALLLEKLGADLGDSVAVELAQAADLSLLARDYSWVKDAEANLRTRVLNSPRLAPVRHAVQAVDRPSGLPPYRIGWEHARAARAALGWDPAEYANVEDLVDVDTSPAPDPSLLGAAIVRADNLAVTVGAHAQTAPRFVAGRALWRALHVQYDIPFLVTNATTRSHRIERAFAAELLAPSEGIELQIGRPAVVDLDTMYSLADHYAVAPTLIRHQLENQLQAVVAF